MNKTEKKESFNKIADTRLKQEIQRQYTSRGWLEDFCSKLQQKGYKIAEQKGFDITGKELKDIPEVKCYGIRKEYISSTINGKATLTLKMAEIYGEMLGVYPEYLLGYVPYRNEAEKKTHELSERSSRMQNHICEIESPDGAMRESIRSFFRLLTLSDYEYHPRMVNSKEFQSYSYEPDDSDFFKACQLEIGSMSDPSFFEDMNLFNIYIVSIDIDGTEYSLINGEFKRLVYSTIKAVRQTVDNALEFASIHNEKTSV